MVHQTVNQSQCRIKLPAEMFPLWNPMGDVRYRTRARRYSFRTQKSEYRRWIFPLNSSRMHRKILKRALTSKQVSENQGSRFESRSGIEVFQEKETIAI